MNECSFSVNPGCRGDGVSRHIEGERILRAVLPCRPSSLDYRGSGSPLGRRWDRDPGSAL